MIVSFLLFCLIGYIPYISTYFAIQFDSNYIKKLHSPILSTFILYSIVKLFIITVVIPEIQGHLIPNIIVTLIIGSSECVAIWSIFKRNKISNMNRGKIIGFIWGSINAFASTFLQFISNSRTYELEMTSVLYSFATISYLFQAFTACHISISFASLALVSICFIFFLLISSLSATT